MTLLQRSPEPHEFIPEDYFRQLCQDELFEGKRPLEIDLGCGDGSYILALAKKHPERAFLGVERLLGRVRKVCRKADKEALKNLQTLRLESQYVVEWLLPPKCASRIHLICPDPWPKAKHHRRRLIQPNFLKTLSRVLEPGGQFIFKTDHKEYFQWALEVFQESNDLQLSAWPESPEFFDPKSDFQVQWESQGKRLHCLLALNK